MPIYNRLIKEGKIDPESVRVLAESPAIPEYMWTFREGLDPAFKEEIRKAFINLTDPEALKAFGADVLHPHRRFRCGPGAHLDRRDQGGQPRCGARSALTLAALLVAPRSLEVPPGERAGAFAYSGGSRQIAAIQGQRERSGCAS